jgi:hypothetical protein
MQSRFVNPPRLDLSQFQEALAAANRHFTKIRKKYPNMRAYLVLSLRGGQAKLDSELADSILEFPSLLLDNTVKTKTLELIKKLKPKESTKPEQIRLKDEIKELAKALEFDGSVQVELRFHDLDYDLIWKLQSDDLVDRELTPQTKASINIVLGSIFNFAKNVLDYRSVDANREGDP